MTTATNLFTVALGLQTPWSVEDIRFEPEQGEIHFHLVSREQRLNCPVCGANSQPIHDRVTRSWQHLHFFAYRAYLHARVPRVACGDCGKVTQVALPWARPGSGFTLLMDALILTLAQQLPVRRIAALLNVSAKRVWQTVNVWVEAARRQESFGQVVHLGVDEKHVGRLGYLTLFHDLERRRVLFGTPGRDARTFTAFREDFQAHGGAIEAVQAIAMDLSKAYQAGARQVAPDTAICFDGFHLAKLVHAALEAVRRQEVKQVSDLKGIRWGTLKAPRNWTRRQMNDMYWLQRSGLKTARAWRMKERWQELHQLARHGQPAEPLYRAFISWARRSRLEPFKQLGATFKAHLEGILNAYTLNLSNAVAESINSLIQAAIVRARGFRTFRNLMNIVYLTAGKLTHLPASPFSHAIA
jgi:transposase